MLLCLQVAALCYELASTLADCQALWPTAHELTKRAVLRAAALPADSSAPFDMVKARLARVACELLPCNGAGSAALRACRLHHVAESVAQYASHTLACICALLSAVAECNGQCSEEDGQLVASAMLAMGYTVFKSTSYHMLALPLIYRGPHGSTSRPAQACHCRAQLCMARSNAYHVTSRKLLSLNTAKQPAGVTMVAQPAACKGSRYVVAASLLPGEMSTQSETRPFSGGRLKINRSDERIRPHEQRHSGSPSQGTRSIWCGAQNNAGASQATHGSRRMG
jgi:hypothetical protein